MTLRFRPFSVALLLFVAVACRRGEPSLGNDTPVPNATLRTPTDSAVAVTAAWPSVLGPFLVVLGGDSPREAAVLLPDTAGARNDDVLAPIRGASLELFGRTGRVGAAQLVALGEAGDPECVAWPRARLDFPPDSVRGGWSVGAASGRVRAIALDSLEGDVGRDSAALVIDIARLASSLPNDTSALFRGLPVIVRSAHRFRPAPGILGLVAEVSRRVAQEAQPLEERMLIIAERDSGSTGPWRAAWSDRVQGIEETIEAADALALLVPATGPAAFLVVQRESARGMRYELMERGSGTTGWTRRWIGPWSGC